jgi:DNA-binding NarL/FixJ family response regulator
MLKKKIAQSLSLYEVCIIAGLEEGKTLQSIAHELDLSERSVHYFFRKISILFNVTSMCDWHSKFNKQIMYSNLKKLAENC